MTASKSLSTACSYQSFETSAAVIQRAGWKIKNPQIKEVANETEALNFIKTRPVRDKRQNLDVNRFRLLIVRLEDRSQLYYQDAILRTAEAAGWIHGEFIGFVEKGTMGSAVLKGKHNISIIMQTPGDSLPFITLSMSELQTEGSQRRIDWVCLLFAASEIDLEFFLREESFPSDYSPLTPDYMFLPVCILKWQMEQVDAEVSIMIARYSFIAADKARRDSSSMKTIAILTLVFLPATTVASIFSMTMFDWGATQGDKVVSKRLWMYFAVAIPLTLVVIGTWVLWYRWSQKEKTKRSQSDIEIAMISDIN
ncbi:hypothetical protein B7494_g2585 [Chlorociboria aeruginascens]|nr:hypothetical protein B7494_g2585 [Chlorociboria aeruginascens]